MVHWSAGIDNISRAAGCLCKIESLRDLIFSLFARTVGDSRDSERPESVVVRWKGAIRWYPTAIDAWHKRILCKRTLFKIHGGERRIIVLKWVFDANFASLGVWKFQVAASTSMCVLHKLRITSLVNLNINQHSHWLANHRLITEWNNDSNLTQWSELETTEHRLGRQSWGPCKNSKSKGLPLVTSERETQERHLRTDISIYIYHVSDERSPQFEILGMCKFKKGLIYYLLCQINNGDMNKDCKKGQYSCYIENMYILVHKIGQEYWTGTKWTL